jgi:hypothetical protein
MLQSASCRNCRKCSTCMWNYCKLQCSAASSVYSAAPSVYSAVQPQAFIVNASSVYCSAASSVYICMWNSCKLQEVEFLRSLFVFLYIYIYIYIIGRKEHNCGKRLPVQLFRIACMRGRRNLTCDTQAFVVPRPCASGYSGSTMSPTTNAVMRMLQSATCMCHVLLYIMCVN